MIREDILRTQSLAFYIHFKPFHSDWMVNVFETDVTLPDSNDVSLAAITPSRLQLVFCRYLTVTASNIHYTVLVHLITCK